MTEIPADEPYILLEGAASCCLHEPDVGTTGDELRGAQGHGETAPAGKRRGEKTLPT